MAGVTTIIAVVALFVGMISIWLVTEAVKKIEKRTQKLIEIHIKGLRQSVMELSQTVNDQKTDQDAVVNRVRDVVRNREAADSQLAALRKEVDGITRTLVQAASKPKSRAGRM